MKEPVFAVDGFIDQQHGDPKKAERLIRLLAERSLGDIAKIPDVAAAGRKIRKEAVQNLAFYRKHLVLLGNVTFIDLTHEPARCSGMLLIIFFPK